MQKEIHIIKGTRSEDYKSFASRILSLCDQVLEQFHPDIFKLTLTPSAPPAISVIPFRREKVAVLSIPGNGKTPFDLFPAVEGYVGSYNVEEAVPVSYIKTWEDRTPTPGPCLLTLFHKKPWIGKDEFIRKWHAGHTPLSLRLHPLWNYNRNVVIETTNPESQWYDGIVEEQFRKSSDLLNPMVFFGPPLKVPFHMMKVWKDTRSFIDMKRIEIYLATEYHIKS